MGGAARVHRAPLMLSLAIPLQLCPCPPSPQPWEHTHPMSSRRGGHSVCPQSSHRLCPVSGTARSSVTRCMTVAISPGGTGILTD